MVDVRHQSCIGYDLCKWLFVGSSQLNAKFTGPGGVTQNVAGFWDGTNNFKFRFTPTIEGAWSYTTSSSDSGLDGKTGTINATAPVAGDHGFLRVDPNYKNSFVWDDGTRYFMEGQTYYDWIGPCMQNDNWKTSVDNSLAYGFNKIRFHVYAQGDYGSTVDLSNYPDEQPYTGTKTNPNRDALNLAYWQKLDEIVQYMDSKGIVADLIVTNPYESNRMYGTAAQNDRFVQYVTARYAAYTNVTWCMANEWESSRWYSGTNIQYQADFARMGGLVHTGDPWMTDTTTGALRPLTIHNQQKNFQFFPPAYNWATEAAIQYHAPGGKGNDLPGTGDGYGYTDQLGNDGIVSNLGHGMPVVNDEYRYIGDGQGNPFPSLTRVQNRRAMWSIAAAGGYSSTADFRMNPNGMGPPECTGDWNSNVPDEYRDIKRMVDFFATKGIEYWKMASHNELTSDTRTYVLAEPGKQYVAYAAIGGTFSIDLVAGSYYAYRYDPQTGTTTNLGMITGGTAQSFSMPDTNDWVLHLSTFQETPEPGALTLLGVAATGLAVYWRRRRCRN